MTAEEKVDKTKQLLNKLKVIRKEQEARVRKVSTFISSYQANKIIEEFLNEVDKEKDVHKRIEEILNDDSKDIELSKLDSLI